MPCYNEKPDGSINLGDEYGEKIKRFEGTEDRTSAAIKAIGQRILKADEGVREAKGTIHCHCQKRQELRFTCLTWPRAADQDLLSALTQEFTYTFGGCTIIRGLDGSYLSQAGLPIQDRINLIYTDTPYTFEENFEIISAYADKLRTAAFAALEEEAILIAVSQVYHTE